jgi:hypothetical protein
VESVQHAGIAPRNCPEIFTAVVNEVTWTIFPWVYSEPSNNKKFMVSLSGHTRFRAPRVSSGLNYVAVWYFGGLWCLLCLLELCVDLRFEVGPCHMRSALWACFAQWTQVARGNSLGFIFPIGIVLTLHELPWAFTLLPLFCSHQALTRRSYVFPRQEAFGYGFPWDGPRRQRVGNVRGGVCLSPRKPVRISYVLNHVRVLLGRKMSPVTPSLREL